MIKPTEADFFYFEKEVNCPSCEDIAVPFNRILPKEDCLGVKVYYKCKKCNRICYVGNYNYKKARKDALKRIKARKHAIIKDY